MLYIISPIKHALRQTVKTCLSESQSCHTYYKVAVYRAVCVSVMLYGCEAWTLYRRHINAFEEFHIRSLQSILGIRWWQKIPHTELFEQAGITPAEHLLLQRQLRWLGHVIRMPDNRLLRRLLYGELAVGLRSVCRPKKRFIDHIKANRLKCNIKPSDLEDPATDRDIWILCDTGLRSFLTGWITASEERRAARHAASTTPKTGPRCPQCNRVCASDADYGATCGLTSSPATPSYSATSSSNSTDFSSSSKTCPYIFDCNSG